MKRENERKTLIENEIRNNNSAQVMQIKTSQMIRNQQQKVLEVSNK